MREQKMVKNNFKSSIVKKEIDNALEYYENSIIPRAMVQTIPVVGSSIDTILTGKISRNWRNNVLKLLQDLKKRLDGIEEKYLDFKYIHSEDFEALIFQILFSLQTTYQEEKIKLFSKIIANSVQIKFSKELRKERIVKIIEELTILHIKIIVLFVEKKKLLLKNIENKNDLIILTSDEIAKKLNVNKYEIEAFCSDLLARAIIYDPHIGTYDYKPGSYALHLSAQSFIEILDLNY